MVYLFDNNGSYLYIRHSFKHRAPCSCYLISNFKLSKQNRLKRRECKDFVEIIKPLYEITSENQKLINSLGKCKSTIAQTINRHQNRTYKVREKTELQLAFEKTRQEVN